MNALRLIYETPPATITVPEEFRHGSVEVIFMPISPSSLILHKPEHPQPTSWLADLAGSWQGTCLVREPQGEYESREELV